MLHRVRRLIARAAIAALIGLLGAVPAFAAVRAGGAPRCTAWGEWPSLKAALTPGAGGSTGVLRRIVTIDFDHDGDLDVIASTDTGVHLWLNDGRGNLVIQTPRETPAMLPVVGVTADSRNVEQSSDSIQNELPSLRVIESRAHAPPHAAPAFAVVSVAPAVRDGAACNLAPRAPPA